MLKQPAPSGPRAALQLGYQGSECKLHSPTRAKYAYRGIIAKQCFHSFVYLPAQ